MTIWHFILPLLAALAVIAAWYLLGGRVKLKVPDHRHVGPIVNGINHSIGCKLEGDTVKLGPGAELHAVLEPCGPLSGKATFSYFVHGEIESANGGKPRACFYFQLAGDDWSARGDMQWKRWYSRKRFLLTPGRRGPFTIPLTVDHWKGVLTAPDLTQEHHFRPQDAVIFGIGFGGIDGPPGEGAMHGIIGNATISQIEFNTGD